MPGRFGRYLEVGRGATPSGDLATTRSINFLALELGDPRYSDGDGLNHDASAGGRPVGWRYYAPGDDNFRNRTVINIPLPVARIAGAEIVSAIAHVPFVREDWPSFSGVHVLGFHLLRKPVDVTDATADEYDDSLNLDWGHTGGQAGVDYDSSPVGTIIIDTTFYNAVVATPAGDTVPHFGEVDITTAMQEAAEKAWTKLQLYAIAQWALAAATSRQLAIQDQVSDSLSPHYFTAISYLPPLSFFALRSDGSIDYGTFLDHEVSDRDARILTGNPPPGGVGPERKAAIANATVNDLTQINIISVRAFAEATTRPSARRFPRFVKVLDDAAGEGYVDGTTRLSPVVGEPTKYEARLTEAFGIENPTPLTTALGNAFGLYSRDETFIHDGKDAFTIYEEWWGLSPAAIVGDEVWRFKHKKDARPSGYTQEAAEAHEMTQHQGLHETGVFNRALADPNKWRDVWNATIQQCPTASRVASHTSAGYGTLDRTHFPVGSVDEFLVGSPATVYDTEHVEHFIIDGKIARTDATNPDQLIAERELVYTYGTDAKVVTGLHIGELGARDRTTLKTAALAGQNFLLLEEAFRAVSGTLRIYSLTSEAVETHAFTVTGNQANFTDASVTSSAFGVGSLIVVVEELSWCPIFFRLKPEAGADETEQLSLVRAIRSSTK